MTAPPAMNRPTDSAHTHTAALRLVSVRQKTAQVIDFTGISLGFQVAKIVQMSYSREWFPKNRSISGVSSRH